MTSRLRRAWSSVQTDGRATTSLDYALIAALIGFALIASLQPVGVSLNGVFAELTSGVSRNVVQYQPYQPHP